jgi:hypothetical protein
MFERGETAVADEAYDASTCSDMFGRILCQKQSEDRILIMVHASAEIQYRIAPTDLVYLWDDCRRCFYDKIKHGFARPVTFSPDFSYADRAMKRAFESDEIVDLGVGPRFRVHSQGVHVESVAIPFANSGLTLSFAGAYDALVVTENEERFIVDFKTTTQEDGRLLKFRRQMACYVLAVERPKHRVLREPMAIDGMALLIFEPAEFAFRRISKRGGLYGPIRWLELPRRDDLFDVFLQSVARVLGGDAPEPEVNCSYCRLRFTGSSKS